MKKVSLLVAGLALSMGATSAKATWTFTVVKTSVNSATPNNGLDVYRYFAKLTGNTTPGNTEFGAQGLQSVDVTLTSTGAFKFLFAQMDSDGFLDADVNGVFKDDTGARNTTSTTTLVRPPQIGTTQAEVLANYPNGVTFTANPSGTRSTSHQEQVDPNDPDQGTFPVQDYDPRTAFWDGTGTPTANHIKSFRVNGALPNGRDPKAVSDASGSLFAVAVVPRNAVVTISGNIAADVGPITTIAVPEPGSFALLGIGAAGLLAKRRRRA